MTLPLEKAFYRGKATGNEITFRTITKGFQVAVEFQILDEGFTGDTIPWIGNLTPATEERTVEALQAAGWKGDDIFALDGKPGDSELAEEVTLVCEPEEYEGKWRLRVQWVNRLSGGFKFKERASADDLRAFSARLRSTVKAVRAAGGAPRKGGQVAAPPAQPRQQGYGSGPAHPPGKPGGPDDDIPF